MAPSSFVPLRGLFLQPQHHDETAQYRRQSCARVSSVSGTAQSILVLCLSVNAVLDVWSASLR
jgi:hypothetical protein